MCTVTVVPLEDGFRLVCNRDERRDRPTAEPPTRHTIEGRNAMFPVDPASRGTWVGVNDVGLAAAILNRNHTPTSSNADANARDAEPLRVSRGRIVPTLLACRSIEEALERCATLDVRAFAPFRLLLVHGATAVIATSNTRALSYEVVRLVRPVMETSSSLGDELVEGPRGRLFHRMLGRSQCAWLLAQRCFHEHQWTSRPEISVMMERLDARTVSQTLIDVRRHSIEVAYRSTRSAGASDQWCLSSALYFSPHSVGRDILAPYS